LSSPIFTWTSASTVAHLADQRARGGGGRVRERERDREKEGWWRRNPRDRVGT
jgi:hypothetical protein